MLAALALAAYAPVALIRRAFGGRRLGDLRGRLGRSSPPDLAGGVWIHAVSVGEIGVAAGLLAALHRRLPGVRIGVSTTTAAGREVAERLFAGRAPVFAFPPKIKSVPPAFVIPSTTAPVASKCWQVK